MPSIPLSNGVVATSEAETSKDKKQKKNKDKKIKNNETTQVPVNDAVSERESSKNNKKRKKVSSSDDDDEKNETSSELVEPFDEGLKSKEKKNKKAKVEMEEEEEHPNAITKFRISEPLRLKLKEKGIESLFPIQAMTFDIILDGSDLVGRARTGQGKTLAFVLPILESLTNGPAKATRMTGYGRSPSVLVLLPTRELANQVYADFEVYGGAIGLSSCCLYGGAPYHAQEIKLKRGVDIVVGTPGRVKDHIERGNIDLSQLKFRVLDEADEMLRMGFVEDVELILGKVEDVNKVQTLLFSATLPDWVKQISKKFLKPNKKTADLVGNEKMKASTNVRHIVLPCNSSARSQLIPDIIRCYSSGGRTIIFTEKKESASELAGLLPGARALHGDIQQSQREVTLSGFRSGKFMTLVATNVAARGLDINDVQLIIQCEPPRDVEAYIHRSGRTGRAGNTGVAVMLYDPRRSNISKIERESGVKFEHVSAPQPDDIAKAVGGEAAEMIIQVSDSVIPAFKSAAEELLNNSGLSAADLLAKALAKAVGFTEIKKRSLLTSMENYVTLLLEIGKPIYSPSFAFGILRRFLPEEKVEAVQGLTLTADGNGAVFDIPAKDLDTYLKGQHNAGNVSLEVLKALPRLQERDQSKGGRFGGGRGFNGRNGGNRFSGGSGGRNGRFSNGRGNGNRGGKRCSRNGKQHHVVGGTVLNQLFNFHRLHDYMTDLARKHKTYRLLSFLRSEVYTSDPVIVEYILRTNFTNYGKGWYHHDILTDLLGDGIFTVDGEKWQHQRKVVSYEISTKIVKDFSLQVFKSNAVKLARVVSEAAMSNKAIDFQELFMKSTLDSVFKIVLGVELDTVCGTYEEGTEFSNAFDEASAITLYRYVDIFWKIKRFFNIGSEAELRKRIKIVDEFVYKLIRQKTEQTHQKQQHDLAMTKVDIVSRFLALKETDPKYLRDIILNFIIAGRDTTATTLSWYLYMLCKHPYVQEKIVHEVREATMLKSTRNFDEVADNLTEEALDKMHYLHATLTETLRLYPAVPVDGKFCLSDETLPDGFSVRRGDMVSYQPYAMGRMKFLWGEDAEEFQPERWLDEKGTFQQESSFKFTAFQAGPRICLGKDFAYRQMKVIAAVLSHCYKFKLAVPNESVNYRTMLTLHIDGGLYLNASYRLEH